MSLILLALGACARYVPRPIEPMAAAHSAAYRARRLDDAPLVEWVSRWAGVPEGRRWNGHQLAIAALALRAELARARADWLAVRAGERTAGVRPAPGGQAAVERAVGGSDDRSPWVVSLAGLFAVELGGKRGARLLAARARTARAESELRYTAWRIVRDTRAAAAGLALAQAERAQAEREVEALMAVHGLERARYQEASVTAAELARTAADVQDARGRLSGAEAGVLEARAALAGTIALPGRALDSLEVVQDTLGACASLPTTDDESLVATALTRRPEMARALTEYATAEADLRLAVARQYPDLELGPGFIWDQGVHRWTLALALPNLLRFRSRAAIDEAGAARTAAAARVAEVQDDLIADIDAAVARCRGATLERLAADSQVRAARVGLDLAGAAYQRGETSRLDPALATLTVVRAERALEASEARLLSAGQDLEAASGGGANDTGDRWPDPRKDDLTEGAPP